MKTIVAITGAGWDPVEEVKARSKGFPIPPRTPEMFWALWDTEHTVLSRQIAQFKAWGASKVFVGTGEPGCSSAVVEAHDRQIYDVAIPDYGRSPWTESQLTYITDQGAIPILMPDPHAEGKSCWTTLLRMAPAMMAADWDLVVISAGDYIFRTAFLQTLLRSADWPSQFWFWTKHSMEFLTRRAFVKFIGFLQSLPDQKQSRVWLRRGACFPSVIWGERKDVFDWMIKDWIEVSHHSWARALALAKEDPV